MTTINNIHDLLELLRAEPEWAEELRAILLTKELLELPAAVASLISAHAETNRRLGRLESDMAIVKEDVSGLKENYSGLKEDVSGLKENYSGLKEDLSSLNTRVTTAEGHLGRLLGSDYERRVEQGVLARTITELGFSRPRVAMSQHTGARPDFHSAIDNALERGTLPVADVRSVFDADLIIRSGDGRHALFEISVTAGSEDVSRARSRADILAVGLAAEVIPCVITSILPEPQGNQAEAAGVKVIVIPDG